MNSLLQDGKLLEHIHSQVGLLSGGTALLSPTARRERQQHHPEEDIPPPPPPPPEEDDVDAPVQGRQAKAHSFFEVVNPVRHAMNSRSGGGGGSGGGPSSSQTAPRSPQISSGKIRL